MLLISMAKAMAIPAAKNGLALTNACNWGIYMGFTFRVCKRAAVTSVAGINNTHA